MKRRDQRGRTMPCLVARVLLVVVLLLSGCHMGTDVAPPSLQPRPRFTDPPIPTIGYSTAEPHAAAIAVATAAPVTRAQLYTLLNQVTAASLYDTISILQGFQTRHVNSVQTSATEGVGAARKFLYSEFLRIQEASRGNFQAFEHSFKATYDGITTDQVNIFGVIEGSIADAPAIVIGAHYDSRADDLTDASGFAPGADDNGSGVAAVLEIARVMSGLRPRSKMIFVLFSAEEVGRQGSIRFVNDYIRTYEIPVRVMINVDTIGSSNDSLGHINDYELRIYSQGPDNSASRNLARMIDFMTDAYSEDLKLVFVQEYDRPGRFGDHFSFTEAGIPAIRIIEALEDTPHREGRDTIEHIEPEYLRRSVRTLATMILSLSDGLPPPSNMVMRDMGEGKLRLVWEPVDGATGYLIALRRPGEATFEQQTQAAASDTLSECTCYSSFSTIAVAALNEHGLMGPLSPEIPVPQ